MPSRLLGSIVFASLFAIAASSAQQGVAEVPLPRENLYGEIRACGTDGQAFLPSSGDEFFVLRVSLDGSSLTFNLPDKRHHAEAIAPYAAGVNILSTWKENVSSKEYAEVKFTRIMYHFDDLGNLVTQHLVSTDLVGAMMATTSSGTTIMVGQHFADSSEKDDRKYGGLILDADDRVVSRFELPSPPTGGTWSFPLFDRRLMTAGDRVAYVLLHSNEPLATEIVTISESGKVRVRTLPEPMLDDTRRFTKWLVGPGVAVEQYYLLRGRPVVHFDEYDLKTGQRIASKTAPPGSTHPLTAACYYADSVTGLGGSVDTPDTLWLRIAKLQ
jgi:hypothetical protein